MAQRKSYSFEKNQRAKKKRRAIGEAGAYVGGATD
jgi:hypothetical protein